MAFDSEFFDWQRDIEGVHVLHAEFAAATADSADHPLHEALVPLLARVRGGVGVEIVFVCAVLDGTPAVRQLPLSKQGKPLAEARVDPDEAAYGALVLHASQGAAHPRQQTLSLPVVSKAGRVFGAACLRTRLKPRSVACADALQSVARMLALVLDRSTDDAAATVWESSAAAPLELG